MSAVASLRHLVRGRLALALAVAGLLAVAPAAFATGTVTVHVAGQGSATGVGSNCSNLGGDCSETYTDTTEHFCDPDRKPPCYDETTEAYASFTAGADANGYVYSGWTGCDSV